MFQITDRKSSCLRPFFCGHCIEKQPLRERDHKIKTVKKGPCFFFQWWVGRGIKTGLPCLGGIDCIHDGQPDLPSRVLGQDRDIRYCSAYFKL